MRSLLIVLCNSQEIGIVLFISCSLSPGFYREYCKNIHYPGIATERLCRSRSYALVERQIGLDPQAVKLPALFKMRYALMSNDSLNEFLCC